MLRWVAPVALLILTPMAAGAVAAGPAAVPFHSPEPVRASEKFAMPQAGQSARTGIDHGSRILAGTELMPNGMIGLGLFGYRETRDPMKAVTAREMALPKSRKMSVGFSLRF